MKLCISPKTAQSFGLILISGLVSQTANAALGPGGSISGSSILGDFPGDNIASEQLTVDWTVSESLVGGIYTYSYDVYNPPGDVLLGNPGTSEIVDIFSVTLPRGLNTTQANVANVTGGSGTGGNPNNGINLADVYWNLENPTVAAGTNSGNLTFTSTLPPSAGDATASDDAPPAPWSSVSGDGQTVPVPGDGDFTVPDTASTLTLLGGMMLLLPFRSAFRGRK
jgi:hypothetical protein